ncbi:hypothetical protein BGZ74_007659 [Mortierella antarctica]|nr:hypothetical protein BGZ74_007659 [Mortierella antarctica]
MKRLADDFDRLERMSFEDAYPSIFDQTFNQFFDLWDHESLLRDVMREADFDLLAPRWQTIRQTTPLREPPPLCAFHAPKNTFGCVKIWVMWH